MHIGCQPGVLCDNLPCAMMPHSIKLTPRERRRAGGEAEKGKGGIATLPLECDLA